MLLLKIGQNALTTLLHSADDYKPRYLPSLLKPVPIYKPELRAPTAHSWFWDIPSKSQTPVLEKMVIKIIFFGTRTNNATLDSVGMCHLVPRIT